MPYAHLHVVYKILFAINQNGIIKKGVKDSNKQLRIIEVSMITTSVISFFHIIHQIFI